MDDNKIFNIGNILVLKEPYEIDPGSFTRVFHYRKWPLDLEEMMRPFHKALFRPFFFTESGSDKKLSHQQIMALTSNVWKDEEDFNKNGGPSLGLYETERELYQVIQKGGGKISTLMTTKDGASNWVHSYDYCMIYWIDVIDPVATPCFGKKLITQMITENTPDGVPFWAKCINSQGLSGYFQVGKDYRVTQVVKIGKEKIYRAVSDLGCERVLYADRFIQQGMI